MLHDSKRKPRARKAATESSVTESSVTESSVTESVIYRTATADAESIARGHVNYGAFSDRDSAYLHFFGSVMRPRGDSATLAEIHASGTDAGDGKRRNPYYSGSSKATDKAVVKRLVKAGFLTVSDNGNRLHATDKARSDSRYLGTRKPV
jgi:hypothetical protein